VGTTQGEARLLVVEGVAVETQQIPAGSAVLGMTGRTAPLEGTVNTHSLARAPVDFFVTLGAQGIRRAAGRRVALRAGRHALEVGVGFGQATRRDHSPHQAVDSVAPG
jgi:hypothetical protein